MNDERPICDSWAAPISLLAAAALSAEEERDLRRHLANCAACRERFEQLADVAGRLRAVRDVRAGRSDRSERPEFDLRGIVARTMSQVADEQSPQRASTRQSGADRRWSSWALVALTAATCLTAAVLVARRSERSAPRDRNLARNVAPGESTEPIEPIQSLGPTLAELRHAAAESDEALDQLLASRSVTLSAESLSFQSLWQESL